MEKLNPYDKQYMRMAMLKHEETFKHQVNELHRLYQVQKILMNNMDINKLTSKANNVNSGVGTIVRIANHAIDRPENTIETMDESEIELTLGPSCYSGGDLLRMNKKKKINSGGRSFSSSSTGSSNNNNNNLEDQMRQERLMKHQKQKQPWLQALTLNVI